MSVTNIQRPLEPLTDPPLLLTKQELADHLRTTSRTVDALSAQGKLPRFRLVGSQRRWLRSEIVSWLDSK